MLSGSGQTANVGTASPSLAQVSAVLFVTGGIAGLCHLTTTGGFGPGFEMVAIARSIASHGAFANPYRIGATGPTAVNPPLYPLWLAFLFRIFKDTGAVSWAAVIGNIAANALTASLLPRISLVLFEDMAPGILAAIPWLAATKLMPAWDASFTVAGLVLFCLLSASSISLGNRPVLNGALAGVTAGAVALLNPASLTISLPWIACLAARRRDIHIGRYCGALFLALCLIVSVWILRNELQLRSPVLRTGFGMSLFVSNNDCATPSLAEEERTSCFQDRHPNTSEREARLVRTLGEAAYDRTRGADATNWIRSHRSPFLRLTLQRFAEFWFPDPGEDPGTAVVVWFITGLSIPGLILMARRREPVGIYLLTVLLLYPPMYYITIADVRYRYPVLWVSALAAGYCGEELRQLLQPVVVGTPGLHRFLDVVK
jgi:hypothetical protein